MTVVQRFSLYLCAALCLCFGVVSAQQPTQQRFLRFLGQRSVTTGTLLPTVEPIRCGLPSVSPLVFAITDTAGQIIRNDSSVVTLSLVEQIITSVTNATANYLNIGYQDYVLADKCDDAHDIQCSFNRIICQAGPISKPLSSGIVEFEGLTIYGKIKPNLTLICSSATVQSTSTYVSLVGGAPFHTAFEKTKAGKLAVPGISRGNELGFIPHIEIGKKVTLHNPDSTDFNYITIRVVDNYGNPACFSTTVTLQFVYPSLFPRSMVLALGNQVLSDSITNLAIFKDLQFVDATCANVLLIPAFQPPWYFSYPVTRTPQAILTESFSSKHGSQLTCSRGWTSATFSLVPGPAVSITPIDNSSSLSGWRGYERLRTFPRTFEIGKSNASDTSRWFYLQAVDQFGNRVDNGPNAYNGGIATIRITPPEEGLPRSTTSNFQFSVSADTYVRANSQRFAATGTSAVAVNGLYTFNNFTPLAPASSSMTDTVVLTFEDPALQGTQVSQFAFPWLASIFRPIPPITTATTTFVRTTNVALRSEAPDIFLTPNPSSDALHIALALSESAPVLVRMEDVLGRTVLWHEDSSAVQGAFATTLDVSRLAQGAYTLHVQSGHGRWTRRVVILR